MSVLDRLELCCLVGPTAAGKSELALALAERAGAELVSLDSMQVYRGMDVGTAKPSPGERARVRHHMLDLADPSERFDVTRFLRELEPVLEALERVDRRALLVGGTAFYLKALTHGLFGGPPVDPELRESLRLRAAEEGGAALHAELARVDPRSAARLHPSDVRRVVRALEVGLQTGRPLSDWQREWGWHGEAQGPGRRRRLVGIELDRAELDRRIAARAGAMLDAGWVEEARAIRAGPGFGPTASQALGYRTVLELADGLLDRERALERIALDTRRFARRQGTWYRRFEELRWLPAPTPASFARRVDDALTALGW